MPNIFVLPASNKNNLYLEILYKPLQHEYRIRPFSFGGIFISLFKKQKTLVHVHWEENIYGSKYFLMSLVRILWRFPLLFFARLCGAKFVWTMHNLLAHDSRRPWLDKLGRGLMWRLAHAVIIQNRLVAEQTKVAYPYKKIVYIPHPNYIGAYGPEAAEAGAQLRGGLGVKANEVLLLSLGALRPYKRLEGLIGAVKTAGAQVPGLRLLIAGKGEPGYVEALKREVVNSSSIILRPQFVPNDEVAHYLAAADYALLAHGDSSLTSGALVLALSYGLPVVALAMPAGELIVDGQNGYAVAHESALIELLQKLPTRAHMSHEEVKNSVLADSPERVAQLTHALYTELISQKLWQR